MFRCRVWMLYFCLIRRYRPFGDCHIGCSVVCKGNGVGRESVHQMYEGRIHLVGTSWG
jgi:hypothetical protein